MPKNCVGYSNCQPLYIVTAIYRFFYESLTVIRPVPLKSVPYYKVSAIQSLTVYTYIIYILFLRPVLWYYLFFCNLSSYTLLFLRIGVKFKYARRIFRKTNISNPLIRTCTLAYQGLEMLAFRKMLRTYLMGGPMVFS